MTMNELTLFLKQNIRQIKNEIIPELGSDFTTLDFVKKFAKKFQGEYLKYLYLNREDSAFRAIHEQIARFLKDYGPLLNIRESRESLFGNKSDDEVRVWEQKKNVYKECYY